MALVMGNYPTTRDSQGEQANPGTSTVMADTGTLKQGIYEVLVIASASADAQMVIQHRDAANTGNVGDNVVFYVSGGGPVEVRGRFDINLADERFRVMMDNALTGDAVATIFAWRVG